MSVQARSKVREEKLTIKKLVNKEDYQVLIKRLAEVRTKVWRRAMARVSKRVEFLKTKYGKCCQHHHGARTNTSTNYKKTTKPGAGDKSECKSEDDPLITGTPWTDSDLVDMVDITTNEDPQGPAVKIYGDITLDYEERVILQRRPEFAMYEKVDRIKMAE